MLRRMREKVDGNTTGKPSTKSGHISDVDYEPLPPLLVDDAPPNDQDELDRLENELAKGKGKPAATPSGAVRDKMDSLLNKRLEERIRQLQMFRTQIQDIQMQNKRDQLAKQIEINKVVDKLMRTKDRLELITLELKQERTAQASKPREARMPSATLVQNARRTNLVTDRYESPYSLLDDRMGPVGHLKTQDDGSYWGIGIGSQAEGTIPPRTSFEPNSVESTSFKLRDWNEDRANEINQMFKRKFATKYQHFRRMAEMDAHFMHTVTTLGCRIIDEARIPFAEKSLKPYALPRKRKMVSELDASDVLKSHVYRGHEWKPVYVFSNIMFEIADDDGDFYGGDEAAAKALSNELRAQEFVALDAVEQGIAFPMSCILDYKGFRLLATAMMPQMADPRDLIDIHGHAQELGDEKADSSWDEAQNDLSSRVSSLGRALNLKPHTIRFNEVTETIALAADVQMFVGKDRKNYIMGLARTLPAEPPTYPIASENMHHSRSLRPELIRCSKVPVNSDSFSAFCGLEHREDNAATRELFNRLKKNIIPGVAQYLDSHGEDDPDLEANLTLILHRHGVNMRFLGLVGRHVKNAKVIRAVCSEMVARHVKHDLQRRWRNLLSKGNSAPSMFVLRTIQLFNLLLVDSEESSNFWENTIDAKIALRFVGATGVKGRSRWQDLCDIAFVSRRICTMCGIVFRQDPLEILKTRPMLLRPDVVEIKPRARMSNMIPQECHDAFEFMAEGMGPKAEEDEGMRRACLLRAKAIFDEVSSTGRQENVMVLAGCGDACVLLAPALLFLDARATLDQAEEMYRRALCQRPQWKEILNRLGDVHCAQADLARIPETAMRLRQRAGARYLQALALEWEMDYNIKKLKTNKLDHLFHLPKADIAAVSIATQRFSNFATIDFSTTDHVGENAIRRAIGKRPVLTDLNLSNCKNATDDVLEFIAGRCTNIKSLNVSNCQEIRDDGVFCISDMLSLTSLTLDGSTGVTDQPLEMVFRNLVKLQTISIRDLPRITDKSAMFMGKFLSQLTCLDISGTSQVTGGVLNEVAQHSLEIKEMKADGCFAIDDVPCITMGRCSPKLEVLSLAGCIKVTSLAVRGLSEKCKHITTLIFSSCIKIDDSALSVLSERRVFPNLKHLDLTACDMISSESIVELITEKPKLKVLRLGLCTQVAEAAVLRIARYGLGLENLSLESCLGCTAEATSQLLRSCVRLKVLSLANCPLVDDSADRKSVV